MVVALFVQASNRLGVQFVRYLFVGGIATVFDFGVFMLLASKGMRPLIAHTLAFVVGVTVNYLLSIRWVFSSRTMNSRVAEVLVFVAVGIAGLGISGATLSLGIQWARLSNAVAKLGAICSSLIWNFAARKALLFRADNLAAVTQDQ